MASYFSEREGDVPPRNQDVPSADFIQTVVTFLGGLGDRAWLARGWPRRCTDDPYPIVGTNGNAFWDEALRTLNFVVRDPRELHNEPQPLKILNLLEFVHQHVAVPINHDFHGHVTHWHLDFDGPQGKNRYADEVNGLFARFGLAFEMRNNGAIVRVPPEEISAALLTAKFQTGDLTLDELLQDARAKFLNPDPTVRERGIADPLARLRAAQDDPGWQG